MHCLNEKVYAHNNRRETAGSENELNPMDLNDMMQIYLLLHDMALMIICVVPRL